MNTDGAKKIDHLLIEHLLSRYLPPCLQETKLAYVRRSNRLDIALAQKLRVRDEWKDREDAIAGLWHVLHAATLHCLWSDLNRCLFEGRQPTPTFPALHVILLTFAAHLRYFKRRLYTSEQQIALQTVERRLKRNAMFKNLTETHLSLLDIRLQ